MNRLRSLPHFLNLRGFFVRFGALFALILAVAALRGQSGFRAVGPDGGDARAFAAVAGPAGPLYLGTTNSWLYESLNGGASWRRLARIGQGDGFVLDHIVVDAADPRTLYVGAWKDTIDGGVWTSHDAGRTWSESSFLKGQPVYALTQAPSDPQVLYAGTIEGVFRSGDAGATWARISPRGSREIHEIESLAVDPRDADVVYAGTWHLPWKTMNAGKNWRNIQRGLIVDSDVFSIVVDPARPSDVYLSACSGIYKSEDAGLLFHKIQGIPNEARRTRVLRQDPENPAVVYAGTTEGLYKTSNAGRSFERRTAPDVVVNDVYVDPANSNRVLLATDRGGVLASNDGGRSFAPSNAGLSERKIAALLVDRRDPRRIYAGVVNDKQFGGVFRTGDDGADWRQLSVGLDGRDVFALGQAGDGQIVAGTSHGIFVLAGDAWQPRNTIANTRLKTATVKMRGAQVNIEKQVSEPPVEFESLVHALDVSGKVWVAATAYGLLTSRDQGASWQGGPVMDQGDFLSVAVQGDEMAAVRDDRVVISHDSGQSWWPMGAPTRLTHMRCVTFSADGALWLGGLEGLFFTRDLGKSWFWLDRLPLGDIGDLSYDAAAGRVLVSSRTSDQIYAIDPQTMTWAFWQSGYRIALVRAAGGRLVAASLNDGVLVGPPVPPVGGQTAGAKKLKPNFPFN